MNPLSPELAPLLEGIGLSPEDAAALESRLQVEPSDHRARAQLVGYYSHLQFLAYCRQVAAGSDVGVLARQQHVLWFIRHAPTEALLRTPFAELEGPEAEEAWRMQLERHPSNAAVHAGAGFYFMDRDVELATALLARAHELEPSGDWEWQERPPRIEPHVQPKSPEELETALAQEGDELARFHLVTSILRAALAAGDTGRLQRHAAHALELAPGFPDDWDHGNGLHLGHTALGLLALDRGDVGAAAQHLLASAQTPGSPQLNSFGPDLQLAQRLLECGERATVRAFLSQCHGFWEMGRGKLHYWIEDLDAGGTPSLRFLG